jgi:hypothetical protein
MKNSKELPDGTVINLDLITLIRKNDSFDLLGNRVFQVVYEIGNDTYREDFKTVKERDERFNYLKHL